MTKPVQVNTERVIIGNLRPVFVVTVFARTREGWMRRVGKCESQNAYTAQRLARLTARHNLRAERIRARREARRMAAYNQAQCARDLSEGI